MFHLNPNDASETSLRTFTAHMRGGDFNAALHSASEACHAAPHLPRPHYAYG